MRDPEGRAIPAHRPARTAPNPSTVELELVVRRMELDLVDALAATRCTSGAPAGGDRLSVPAAR